jgi:hypothetical protein
MILSVRRKSPQLSCSFYFYENEFHTSTPLLSNQLLRGYRDEIALAAQGFRRPRSIVPALRRELRHVIPQSAITVLRQAFTLYSEATTLALEIMLNDPEILECYPWELLSERGLLLDRRIAVIVWRSIVRPKLPRHLNSAILLVGSASSDTISKNVSNEIASLAGMLRDYPGIHPYECPSISFAKFTSLVHMLQPSVINIVTHSDISDFRFKEDPEFSVPSSDISSEELGTYLSTTTAAGVVLLNACNSASSWDNRASIARKIATGSPATTIGMSAEIPSSVGSDFSKNFLHALVSGYSVLEAFSSAIQTIKLKKKFATLWSTPIMYASPDSNVILFPTDAMARIRLRFQELGRQLRQLESETAALSDYNLLLAQGGSTSIGAVAIRLAYTRGLLDELDTSALEEPEHLHSRLLLTQTRNHASSALKELGTVLDTLRDPRRSREQRSQTIRSICRALNEQVLAFVQLEREVVDSR